MFKILSVRQNPKTKEVMLERGGIQYACLVFPDFPDYENLEIMDEVDGWIRTNKGYVTLVSYSKPQRNWLEGETFI